MPRSGVKRQTGLRKELSGSPELLKVARQLALLALAQQDGPPSPRQREELRRALAIAGDALGWAEASTGNGDSGVDVNADMMTLATKGAESLERDLVEERAKKQKEVAQLLDAAAYAQKLGENPKTTYPADITYCYTIRDPYQRLITKTATNTVNDPQEALGAAEALRRSIEARTKLTDLMVIDLEQRRERLTTIARSLPDFVRSSRGLLVEVIANLS